MKTNSLKIQPMYGLPVALFLFSLSVSTPVLWADSAATSTSRPADLLAEALPILQANYADFKNLPIKEGDHLSDLIARSNGKISLSTADIVSVPTPILTVPLADNILYWRLASFTPQTNWTDLESLLAQQSSTALGIVLDLRSNLAPDDYAGAGQVLGFFAPDDKTLNQARETSSGNASGGSMAGHPFHSPIIVLTNGQTTGAAEALAACLKADGALVVGRATAGKIAIFAEQKLSTGQMLRYMVTPVGEENSHLTFKLPLNTSMWGHPVIPDIALAVNDEAEKRALIMIAHNHVADVIGESANRHRMSEAALVQGDDPEWDDYLITLGKNSDHFLLTLPTIHDIVLINALDSLKAIGLAERPAPPSADTSVSVPASAAIE